MAKPFTLRVFVADGDPEGVRIIDRMNWTGLGITFPREKWPEIKKRSEFNKTGVYILVGYQEDDDLPTLYIGQGDGIGSRIDAHYQSKDFWNWALAFVSTNDGLNRAHITWLEYALVKRAGETKRCHLDNGNTPQEPALTEAEKADTKAFLEEMFQILPLVGLRAFEHPKVVAAPKTQLATSPKPPPKGGDDVIDTMIVPAKIEGFEETFLGENCWYAVRISGGMLKKIKYVAAYQTQPVSAITHYAPVDHIEPYGNEGKYKLVFSAPAQPIGPIPRGDAPKGTLQGSIYRSLAQLKQAKTIADLLSKAPSAEDG
jgi:hypothetical protein